MIGSFIDAWLDTNYYIYPWFYLSLVINIDKDIAVFWDCPFWLLKPKSKDIYDTLMICWLMWWQSWNFKGRQVKFNWFLHPIEHTERIFWYLLRSFEGGPQKSETSAHHSLPIFGTMIKSRGAFSSQNKVDFLILITFFEKLKFHRCQFFEKLIFWKINYFSKIWLNIKCPLGFKTINPPLIY